MMLSRVLSSSVLALGWTAAAAATEPPGLPAAVQGPPQQTGEAPPAAEIVVISASRREEQLINAPVAMTVITDEAIRDAPSRRITDLLRLVPGINAVQLSARDVNVTSRAATGTLSNTLLVLVDGRSVYQDFFGTVLWDFLSIAPEEVKQIEVIRGPASAVWGANAMTGVVNVITKRPREMQGTSVSFGFGLLDRTREGEPTSNGGLFSLSAVHGHAPSEEFAYKISAGFHTQEPFLRPVGTVPGGSTPFPPFDNRGTTQPRLDARADYDFPDGRRRISLAGGIAGTTGMVHTGIGPFDIRTGSTFKYGRVTYERDKLTVRAFVNALDAEAPVPLQRTPAGAPLETTFENQVYDIEVSNQHALGVRHLISYGGNYRHNAFDLSIAPLAHRRDEGGAYLQDQMFFLSERLRWIVGARIDVSDTLGKVVFSPRTALLARVRPNHMVRLSFNRSFRSPSFVNNFFDLGFFSQVDLTDLDPSASGVFAFQSRGIGNPELAEERLTAYEAGYVGVIGRMTVGAAVYVNYMRNVIQFTVSRPYTSANPPPGWPLSPELLDRATLAAESTYANLDLIVDRGLELSVEGQVAGAATAFANYTWQAEPDTRGFPPFERPNRSPAHRVNAGVTLAPGRYFASVSASVQDKAFWQDVLGEFFAGDSSPYGIVNGGGGVRSGDGTMEVAVRGTNLLNRRTQQHPFGDPITRTIIGEFRVTF